MSKASLERAVLKCGDGRGFVVEIRGERYVLTAGHCLPTIPPCLSFSFGEERTYAALLGPLGEAPTLWAECLFVDPISDLAVLGSPDGQVLSEDAKGWDRLIGDAGALHIGDVVDRDAVSLLCLDGTWQQAIARTGSRSLWIENARKLEAGMSGSPILSVDGKAVGVFTTSRGMDDQPHTSGGPQVRLSAQLPGWLLG